MKKSAFKTLLLSFLISCGSSTPISKIDRYIKTIDKKKDFNEIITEYTIEESSKHDLSGGGKVSVLTDNDGIIIRIIANDNKSNREPASYKFYYQNGNLIFSNLIILNKERNDTISDIDYYFMNKNLIRKRNRKQYDRHSEFIIEISEYYKRQYGK